MNKDQFLKDGISHDYIGVVGRFETQEKYGQTVILPDTFAGESSWECAPVNGRGDAEKLNWLKVQLTRQVQMAFKRLSEEARGDYVGATVALHL